MARRRLRWLALTVVLLACGMGGIVVLPKFVAFKANRTGRRCRHPALQIRADRSSDCSTCPPMLALPAGTSHGLVAGSTGSRSRDERPRVEVTLTHPFAHRPHEVTFAQWQACLDDGGCAGWRRPMPAWARASGR